MTLLMAPCPLGSSHNLSSPHSPSGLGDNGFLLLVISRHLTTNPAHTFVRGPVVKISPFELPEVNSVFHRDSL